MVAEVSLMIKKWLGVAITWANVDPDLCRQIVSLGLNELISSLCLQMP